MTASTQSITAENQKIELKAGSFTLLKLCMSDFDADAIDELLSERVSKAPEFFRNTPVIIDLDNSNSDVSSSDLAVAIGAIRGYGLVPVGVRGGSKGFHEQARLLELAVFPRVRRSSKSETQKQDTTSALPAVQSSSSTKVVSAPIRSGQRVYAQGDIILLAPVSSGAEVVADGNVHAYAPIRGRVMAGIKGNEEVSIFCTDLNAELVSIAGRYKVSEDLDPRLFGHLVSVTLEGNALIFKKL
jgi:septum site-determining protein MinC